MKLVGMILYRPTGGLIREEELLVYALGDGSHAMECYGCGTRFRLNPQGHVRKIDGVERIIPGHRVTVKRNGRCLISAPILCRNGLCGWYVVVDARGIARDATTVAGNLPKRADVPGSAIVVGIESRQPRNGRVSGAGLGIRMELFG